VKPLKRDGSKPNASEQCQRYSVLSFQDFPPYECSNRVPMLVKATRKLNQIAN
jgi:hypothetical protein